MPFRLITFGGLRLTGLNSPLTGAAAQPRPLATLAVLASSGERGMAKARLTALLWPDRTDEQARHALAQMLYALRRDTGADTLTTATTGIVALNPAAITFDVADFRRLAAAHEHAEALALYHGPFLDGIYLNQAPDFERWVDGERADLMRTAVASAKAEADRLEGEAQHRRAAEYWAMALDPDPTAVEPRRRLIAALAAAGEFAAALEQARQHHEAMAELELPPADEITVLVEELRRQRRHSVPGIPASAPASGDPHVVARESSKRGGDGPVPTPPRRSAIMLAGVVVSVAVVAALLIADEARRSPPATPVVAVGVIQSHISNDTNAVAIVLSDLLTTQLAQIMPLHVVSRTRLLEVLGRRIEIPGPGVLASAARSAGASELVDGAAYRDSAGYRLDLRRSDLRGGKILGAVSVTAADPVTLVEQAVERLAASWDLPPPARPLGSVTSVSLVARRLYERGLRAMTSMHRDAADDLFRAALDEDSTFAMAAYHVAVIDRFPVESLSFYWQRAVRLAERSGDRERLMIGASAAFHLNDARGLALADTLAIRYPFDIDGLILRGDAQVQRGEFAAAIKSFQHVIELDSAGPTGRSARCQACDAAHRSIWAAMMGDSLQAAERIGGELSRWPASASTGKLTLVTTLLRQGCFVDAMKTARELATQSPGAVSVDAEQQEIWQRSGQYDRLDSSWMAAVGATTDSSSQHSIQLLRAHVLREAGRPRAALALTPTVPDELLDVQPFSGLQRAATMLALGRISPAMARDAARLFERMAKAEIYPEARMARHRAWMWTHMATALAEAGDTAALPGIREQIAQVSARSSYARDRKLPHYVSGLLLESRGDWRGAMREYRASIYSPTETIAAQRFARAALNAGEPPSRDPGAAGSASGATRCQQRVCIARRGASPARPGVPGDGSARLRRGPSRVGAARLAQCRAGIS